MQAIILAAGMGKRLGKLTQNNTKCMVEVGGVRLIERALYILDKKNLSRIVMVVGYQCENLMQFVDGLGIDTPVEYIINEVYDRTNNIYSLSMAKDWLVKEDTLLLESDLIFEEALIDLLLEDSRETLALVDKFENWMDGTCLVVDEDDQIVDFIPGKLLEYSQKERYYKTVNIYKLSADFSRNVYVPFLEAYARVMGNNEYYETVIKLILMLDKNTMRAKRLEGQRWYEIDDIQDLDIAEVLFAADAGEQYKKLTSRYGGYWRFPHLKDFCYLVNPYFPPARMMEELKSNFDILVRQYPSGMRINCLLAAKTFGISEEHIVLGNGAAELIKALLEQELKQLGWDGNAGAKDGVAKAETAGTDADARGSGQIPYLLYQLGKSYYMMGEYGSACGWFAQGLSFDLNPALEYVIDMVETYGYALINSGQEQTALFFENIYDEFGKSADFQFLMGLIYMKNARFTEAVREFEKAAGHAECRAQGVNSYRADYNIGVIYECLGKKEEALAYYRKCGGYAPAEERIRELGRR